VQRAEGGGQRWLARFEEFAARKERAATAAELAPFSTEIDKPEPTMVAIGNEWSRRLFDGPFYASNGAADDLPATNLVFVQSREGNTIAKTPAELGGGASDLHLIYEGLSRVCADAVLAGAETTRSGAVVFSTWHPELVALRLGRGLPRHPVQIVATLRGVDFDGGMLFNLPDIRVVLLTVPPCAAAMQQALGVRPWITTIAMPTPDDLPDAFRTLRQMGIARISAIGGRTLARALVDASLVDDLYLTTSAISAGQPDTPLYPGRLNGDVVVRKRGTGPDEGVVFEHSVRLRRSATFAERA
jgi:riboflavin biosynthesis pyrimidine reductase